MLTAAFISMELCWLALAVGLAWVGWGGGAWPPPVVALLPSPLGAIGARLSPDSWRRRRWYDLYRWSVALGTAALCARLATLLGDVERAAAWNVAFIAGLILFWRGWAIGEDLFDARAVELAFQVGAVAVLVLLAALQWNVREGGLIPSVGFFLFGLVAIGLARRGERRLRGTGPEPDWLTLIVLLGLGTLVVAAALVSAVSPDLLRILLDQAAWLARLVGGLFATLLGWLPQWAPAPPVGGSRPGDVSPIELPGFWLTMREPYRWIARQLVDGALFLLIAYAVYRIVRYGVRRASTRGIAGRGGELPRSEAPAFSWHQWWELFVARVRGWLRRRRASPSPGRAVTGDPEPSREQRSVRELYRDFLRSAVRLGLPRASHQTPHEFASSLAARHPAARSPVTELTRVYVRARYAEERIEADQVALMRAAVERATAALRTSSE